MSPLAEVSEYELSDRLGDICRKIFGGCCPSGGLCYRELDRVENGRRIAAAQQIAPTFDRLRAFGYIADRDVRDLENCAFLLHRSAVG